MSYSAPGSYNGWEAYAGQPFAIKADDDSTLLTGTIAAAGCGTLSIPFPDNYVGGAHWFVNGVKRKVGSFDYRQVPEHQGGAGPYSVTIDAGTPGAAISLSQGIDVAKGVTGDDGRVQLKPAALGSYALVVTKAGYTPISRIETLTDGMTIDAELQSVVIPQPADPNLATVVFRAIDFGAKAPGIKVKFTPVARGAIAIEGAYETDHQIEASTDETGVAVVELYPASVLAANGITPPRYYMESKQCGNLKRMIEVPDEGGLAFAMLVDL